MERSVISISILVLGCLVASAAAQSASNVNAYSIDYHTKELNWDMSKAHVFCATWDAHRSLEWRSKYNWIAFCGPDGPHGQEACGKCLNVTNTDTKDEEIARIVDACGSGGLELDLETAFNPIDTNGKGNERGHLIVDYEFVDCESVPIPPPPAGTGESNVTAYWTDYNVTNNNWDYFASPVSCAPVDVHKPLEWRSKYGWTGFCGNVSLQWNEACGKCLMGQTVHAYLP
ncbi:hypothetical protein CRYUN_Cryun05aG0026700 [Craigia yunnanensis]